MARKGENYQQLNRFNRWNELTFATRSSLTYLLFIKTPRSSHVTFPAYRGLSVPAWFVNKPTTECFSYEKDFINAKNHSEKKPQPADTVTSQCCYQADLAIERESQLTTEKRAERTTRDFLCTSCSSAIGQASCFICTRLCQLTSPFCC